MLHPNRSRSSTASARRCDARWRAVCSLESIACLTWYIIGVAWPTCIIYALLIYADPALPCRTIPYVMLVNIAGWSYNFFIARNRRLCWCYTLIAIVSALVSFAAYWMIRLPVSEDVVSGTTTTTWNHWLWGSSEMWESYGDLQYGMYGHRMWSQWPQFSTLDLCILCVSFLAWARCLIDQFAPLLHAD